MLSWQLLFAYFLFLSRISIEETRLTFAYLGGFAFWREPVSR
jgi:hypothetical protein